MCMQNTHTSHVPAWRVVGWDGGGAWAQVPGPCKVCVLACLYKLYTYNVMPLSLSIYISIRADIFNYAYVIFGAP